MLVWKILGLSSPTGRMITNSALLLMQAELCHPLRKTSYCVTELETLQSSEEIVPSFGVPEALLSDRLRDESLITCDARHL